MKRVAFLTVLLLTLTLSQLAFAQELASLSGVVSDKTGAVIPDADVRLTDTKTNASYSTKTNSVGGYTFVKLLPGPGYRLVFTKDGFESVAISDIYIGVGTTHTQNVQLRLGKVTESVEVSGQGEVVTLDTTDTVVGKNFDMKNVHDLPIQGRFSPIGLLDLLPGVADTNANNDPNSSRAGAVTGARTDQTNVTLDGLDVNDFATGQSFTTVGNAPVDSIQEFRAETANPLAASGRGSGAQVELVTKSGSNSYHGAVFEYLRNTLTDANNFFADRDGTPKPQLALNQFGANLGGPVMKDKLFFFFDYQGLRQARGDIVEGTVPLDSFRAGNVSYINKSTGCTPSSRINTTPGCISTVPNTGAGATVTSLDPQGVGSDKSLLTFLNSRYPHANDLTAGDGVNTGGFRFNAPAYRSVNNYVGRVDYNMTNKMKLFGRVSIVRDNGGDDVNNAAPIQFPGDPLTNSIVDHSYAYVVGHTWTLSNTKVNQFFYGETRSDLNFPVTFNPVGVSDYGSVWGPLTGPFASQETQHRIIPVPVYRDDFTYVKGKHNFQMGGTFKPIRTRSLQVRDLNFIASGIGGNLQNLDDSLRPANILQDGGQIATGMWDTAFTFDLGRFATINSNFNNARDLQPLPQGTGHTRNYRYYETETYFQDTWRMRPDLTLTAGLRYQYYSVPYETNGLEAIPNLGPAAFYAPRAAAGAASSFDPLPLITYDVGGKVNHGPGLYKPDWKDFAPRLAFAYNPASNHGVFGHLFGDRKTVIRGGAGIVFDHPVTNAINFVQDQASYLFQNSSAIKFGDPNGDPEASLLNDPRFTDINSPPPPATPSQVTRPFTPFLDNSGQPDGTSLQQDNYAIDPNLKTPYSITYTFGLQRELPGNFLVEATYFGRQGRRLLAQSDAGQVVDFTDPGSGHKLVHDFFDLSQHLRNGVANPTAEPFFENEIGTGFCQAIGFANCTDLMANGLGGLVPRGDLTDSLVAIYPLLPPGVGLHPQFGGNVYVSNKGYSSYNGLLTSLHKKTSHGLQFDVNYTYSHSIDNVSAPANNVFGSLNFSGGVICDFTDLGKCKGNSDFDVTHLISGNGIWDIPVGRGRHFATNAPGWLNQMVGGWQLSVIEAWSSGFAFTSVTNAFPITFLNNAPAVFNGDTSAIKTHVHVDPSGTVQLFADPAKALGAFRGPLGLEGGTRNNLRGPHFSNFDIGLSKHFPITERVNVQFRADAFNAFNHPNFNLPGGGGTGGTTDISNPGQFGVINSTANPRQMQFALRVEF